jgi:molecular chaperone DnaK
LKTDVENKISVLKNAIETNDVAQMQTATADLSTAMQQIGQAVYSQSADGSEPGAGDTSNPSDESGDDTVEGEFREV